VLVELSYIPRAISLFPLLVSGLKNVLCVCFLLQSVLDCTVHVVVEDVFGGCGSPFINDKDVVNVCMLCFFSLSFWG
jgi:hypothetical protein